MAKRKKITLIDILIAAGIALIYVGLMYGIRYLMGFNPILYFASSFVVSLILGPVYVQYITRVPTLGASVALGALCGIVNVMDSVITTLFWCLLIGLMAEVFIRGGYYRDRSSFITGYVFQSGAVMAPFWGIAYNRIEFLAQYGERYGEEAAEVMSNLTPSNWVISITLVLMAIGAVLGGNLGFYIKDMIDKNGDRD